MGGVVSALEHVAKHARRAGDHARASEALVYLAPGLFWGPMPVSDGLRRAQAIVEEAAGNAWVEASAKRALVGFYALQGHFAEAREQLAESRTTLEELGRPLDACTLAF